MFRKFYTIDDLYKFCKENKYEHFSSMKQGAPLIVQSIGSFEASDSISDGLMPVKLKSCHTGKNRNQSGISDETMNLYKNSFKGRPILGAIYKTDTGEYEFRGHDMEFVEDGDNIDVNYIEQPIGVISQTVEPYLEFDENEKKNFLMVEGTIFTDYSKAAEILNRRKTCKCSVEIAVEEMSYNCDEDYLSIDKFHFIGVTILGYQQDGVTAIQEGMAGSKITIDDFSINQNSMFSETYQEKLIETLDKLNTILSNLNTDAQKGGSKMNKLEELMAQYNITAEDVTFDTEGLSDEELEAKFAEVFGDQSANDDGDGDGNTSGNEGDDGNTGDAGDGAGEPEQFTKTFSVQISHEETAYALYNLIAKYEEEDNDYYFIKSVYDNYFYMQGWCNNKIYKVGYSIDGQNVALEGERQEMFEIIVSESEKLSIEKMREDYEALKAFKENYDAEKLNAEKKAILDADEYAVIAETKEFNELVSQIDKFSIDELKIKADLIFASVAKKQFALDGENKNRSVSINLKDATSDIDKKPYGTLFDN
jgi:hypothetical protein